ncbi:MAG: cyclic nucleotide-binding domain-containing protein [Gammaproteobacteria bacterium]
MSKQVDRNFLKTLTPLNGLKPENQQDLATKTHIQALGAGRYIFKQGDADKRTIYVVNGEVELRSGDDVVRTIKAGTSEARHPLAPQIPRQVSARAKTDIEYLAIDSDLLDIMLTWDQTGAFEVGEIAVEEESEDGDWMTMMLQTKAFHKVPPANIQAMFMRMEPVHKKPNDPIIKQGEDGDYFYIMTEGTAIVTRQTPTGQEIKLAELSVGDSFGEEALISDAKRNANVTMTTKGMLMRLSKDDFNKLLNEPMLNWVEYTQAQKIIEDGGQWLDVRLPGEFEDNHQQNALNIPLQFMRLKLSQLDEEMPYVVCCDTGRRSSAAAYILSERGYHASVLKGGLSSVPQ